MRRSGRSWWQSRYLDGTVLSEWDTLASLIETSSRWEEVPKKNMIGLRILTPIGQIGELEAPEGHRFFQLKQGVLMPPHTTRTLAHIIGVVTNLKGDCRCWIYESGAKRLIEHWDNVSDMAYGQIGPLNLDVQQLRS